MFMDSKRIGSKEIGRSNVVAITACAPQVSAETVSLLERLLEEARAGTVIGLAVAVLRSKGNYDLRLLGNATENGEQMAVAGMLAALQKMVLELEE
jgi:hypothetical protein